MEAIFQFVNGPNSEVTYKADSLGNLVVRVKSHFRHPEARAEVAYLCSATGSGDDEETIQKQVLSLSGKSGEIHRVICNEGVVSAYEAKKAAEKDKVQPALAGAANDK